MSERKTRLHLVIFKFDVLRVKANDKNYTLTCSPAQCVRAIAHDTKQSNTRL